MESKEKEREWNQLRAIVDRVKTGGLHIDPEIRDTITALWVLGFKTTSSCAGHLDHGLLAPWIHISEWEPRSLRKKSVKTKILIQISDFLHNLSPLLSRFHRGLKLYLSVPVHIMSKKGRQEIEKQNLKEQVRFLQLLDEFYQSRETSRDVSLILENKALCSMQLISFGVRFQRIRPKAEREEKLIQYQQEMADFTAFLKKKCFKN